MNYTPTCNEAIKGEMYYNPYKLVAQFIDPKILIIGNTIWVFIVLIIYLFFRNTFILVILILNILGYIYGIYYFLSLSTNRVRPCRISFTNNIVY